MARNESIFRLASDKFSVVIIPRKRMIQDSRRSKKVNGGDYWMPACAGMTLEEVRAR
jgi:hypothetical protein